MKKGPKIFLRIIIGLVVVLAGAYGIMLMRMSATDKEHARFYEAGKTINQFLADYTDALKKLDKEGDTGLLSELHASDFEGRERGNWRFSEPRHVGDVDIQDLEATPGGPISLDTKLGEIRTYMEAFTSVKRIKMKIDLIEEMDPDKHARLSVKYILDGSLGDTLVQDRYFMMWHLKKGGPDDAHTWLLTDESLVQGVRVAGNGQVFEAPAPEDLGIDYVHQRDPKLNVKKYGDQLKFAVIEHAHGGISAADFDSDGLNDLFFLDGVRSRLYRNTGEPAEAPHFEDVTVTSGLDGIDQATSAMFFDADNDGDQDLFVTRYLVPCLFYRNNDGRFEDETKAMGLDLVAPSISTTLLDYDKDGFIDIYVGVNGNAFEALPRLPFFAQNGKPNRLLKNQGGTGFLDKTAESGTGDTGWSLAVASGDYDGDGWTDIVVANDFGRKNLYRNLGDGTFEERSKEAGTLDFSGGMGVVFADLNDDGHLDLYTSNIKSNQRWFGEDQTVIQYINNVFRTKYALVDFPEYREIYNLVGSDFVKLGQEVGEGNSVLYNDGDGTFHEKKDANANQAGWGWSVCALDFDNDTDLDLYAANGWITNTPGTDL